jgi:GT2 family glycosyltransferase
VPRTLLAILVYDGRDFVPRCLESAQRVAKNTPGVDVLVLDDCSPEPGWSEELAALAASLELGYYRSPRNLGIPRNMNLGLSRAVSAGYDEVVILNSDVILPARLVEIMSAVAQQSDRIASVTAWSNNCSAFSLPSHDPNSMLCERDTVDGLTEALHQEFGHSRVVVPTGVGFCMLIPSAIIETVGLFDPVFGRGYCEELDWCLRASALGFENVLAPGVFVYHEGGASTQVAGLLRPGETTVQAHEHIIDWRYPSFRSQVASFFDSELPDQMRRRGLFRIVSAAAAEHGYDVEAAWAPMTPEPDRVRVMIAPDGEAGGFSVHYRGLVAELHLPEDEPLLTGLECAFGRAPDAVTLYGSGARATQLAAEAAKRDLTPALRLSYPVQVGPAR